MKTTWSIDLIWWITAFEFPVIGALFWMIWRNRQDFVKTITDVRGHLEHINVETREQLSAYKLDVAKNYASITYMKDVERRLTGHLVRIENKLDQHTLKNGGYNG